MRLSREPALWLAALAAVLTWLVTFHWSALSAEQSSLIVAFVTAGVATVTALMTRPIAPTAFSGAVQAGSALLAGYGLHMSAESVGTLTVAVVAVMTLLVRAQVEPKAGPVTAISPNPPPAA